VKFFRVLKRPSLALLWSGQVFSSLGDQFFEVALLWLTTKQLGAAAGFIFGTASFVALLFGLFGGVIADRWDRRSLLIGSDVGRCVLIGLLPVLIWMNGLQVWFLLMVILIGDLLGTIFDPALQASLPLLTENIETLYDTNALMDTTSRFARVLGPGLTGILLVFLPFVHFFTLDAITFGISACTFLVLGTRLASPPPSSLKREEGKKSHILGNFLHDVIEGYHLAYKHTAFFWSIVSLGLINMAWSIAYTIGLPLWTQRILHGSPALLGIMISGYGFGNVISLFVGTLGKRRPLTSMYIGKIVQGIGFILLAVTSSSLIAVGSMFVSAIGGALGDITLATMIQTDFPTEHVGKIYSLRRTVGNLGLTFGALASSLVYLVFNVSTGILLSGLLISLIGVICLFHFRLK